MADQGEDVEERSRFNQNEFLAEVQKYECIYNKYCKDFKDKYKKINCWEKIGRLFCLTAQEAETKFKNLRSSYTRFLRRRKKIPLGSGGSVLKKQESEFAAFEWLVPYITIGRRSTTNNFTSNTSNVDVLECPTTSSVLECSSENPLCESDIQSDDSQSIDSSVSTERQPSVSQLQTSNTPTTTMDSENENLHLSESRKSKKRPWSNANKKPSKAEVDKMLMNTAQSIDEHLRKSKDAKEDVTDSDDVALFFKSLVPRFKRLSQNAKSCVRLQIEQTFFNAECSYPGMNEVDSPHMKTGSWNTSGYRMYDHSQYVMPSTQYQGFTTINPPQSDVLNASFNHD